MNASVKPLLRQIADGEVSNKGRVPPLLWLIPILLRSRSKYYDDLVADTRRRIDSLWVAVGFMSKSREEFENSSEVDDAWKSAPALWWGVNDIIGFIEIHLLAESIDVSLFFVKERPTRMLTRKNFEHRDAVSVPTADGPTNETPRSRVIEAVRCLAGNDTIRRHHIDIESWELAVAYTDPVGLTKAAHAGSES